MVKSHSARFFSVGRVFRNEKLSYKHLVEFHQVEGVATDRKLSLRKLIGLQKEFYARMGITRIKFWPTFFPYTEPSLQSMVYNEKLGKWVELFGMGIFRPEVTKPLGIENPVLAWGGGLERIAMLRFGLDDVRELYSNKLSWLRSVTKMPVVSITVERLRKFIPGVRMKKILDMLPFVGLDIEDVDNNVIRVEYNPNRPDFSSDYGIARALRGLLEIDTGIPKLKVSGKSGLEVRVEPTVKKIRPYIVALVARNGRLDDETIK